MLFASRLRWCAGRRQPLFYPACNRRSETFSCSLGLHEHKKLQSCLLRFGVLSSTAHALVPHRCVSTSTGECGTGDAVPSVGQESVPQLPQAPPSLRQTLPPDATELPEYSFLKCIEKEMMDEKLRLDKEDGPPPFPLDWEFYHPEGTSLIYGRRIWVPPISESAGGVEKAHANKEEKDSESEVETTMGSSALSSCRTSDGSGGKGRFAEKHFIRAQLTIRDASLDPECDIRGEHFPFSFYVQPLLEEGSERIAKRLEKAPPPAEYAKFFQEEELSFLSYSIEVRCDLVDGELRAEKVVVHGELDTTSPNRLPTPMRTVSTPSSSTVLDRQKGEVEEETSSRIAYPYLFSGFEGPNLDEAEEDILDGLQAWLAERRVDDLLAEFIGSYSVWIEQMEYERWLQHLHDYVAA